jgi:hypothetical protein
MDARFLTKGYGVRHKNTKMQKNTIQNLKDLITRRGKSMVCASMGVDVFACL